MRGRGDKKKDVLMTGEDQNDNSTPKCSERDESGLLDLDESKALEIDDHLSPATSKGFSSGRFALKGAGYREMESVALAPSSKQALSISSSRQRRSV